MALKKEFGLKTSETDWLGEAAGSIRDPAVGKQLLNVYLADNIGKATPEKEEVGKEDTSPSGKETFNAVPCQSVN